MARLQDHELTLLKNYVPEKAADDVLYFMHSYHIHLKIKRERKAILGDYRPAMHGKPHTISINATLNAYHFLITFVHELAHLVTFLNHHHRVQPHGKEWKGVYRILMSRFLGKEIFPAEVEEAIQQSLHKSGASTCSEPELYKVLRRYDEKKVGYFIEELEAGTIFFTDKGKRFQLMNKRRTRYECKELSTGHVYLFPGIYEVTPEV